MKPTTTTKLGITPAGVLALSLIAVAATSQAAVVTVNQNIVSFLTTPNTLSGHTNNVVFNDGLGSTVTLRFTVTTQSGENFTNLGSNVGIGPVGHDGNHIDPSEGVGFAVNYFSHTGTVDLSSIAFRFDSIGFRKHDPAAHNLSWTVNGGTPTVMPAVPGETNYNLDSGFTTIGTNPSAYTGVFTNLTGINEGQLSRNTPTTGLQFSAQFVPEPTSALLLLGSGAMLLLRRRRAAAL